jgi:hypothetical protein
MQWMVNLILGFCCYASVIGPPGALRRIQQRNHCKAASDQLKQVELIILAVDTCTFTFSILDGGALRAPLSSSCGGPVAFGHLVAYHGPHPFMNVFCSLGWSESVCRIVCLSVCVSVCHTFP